MSVNWFERAEAETDDGRWRETERLIAASPRTLKPSHLLASLPVRGIRSVHRSEQGLSQLGVFHEPDGPNYAHGGVDGMPNERDPLALALAQALAALVSECRPCCVVGTPPNPAAQ